MVDVTDSTFETAVLDRSEVVPVIVDLWAPWCGPCKTLGPTIEAAVAATGGQVELTKVNVDDNPRVAASFAVQSIPAVFALRDRQVVDHFIGALREKAVTDFVNGLIPQRSEVDDLIDNGDEASLRRVIEIEPGNEHAIIVLAELLIEAGNNDEALEFLGRLPETPEIRRLAALARTAGAGVANEDDVEIELRSLLEHVKTDADARQRYVDLLEVLGASDPRTTEYRRALSSALF